MITFLDKTFCASPNCKDECGRRMTEEQKSILSTMKNQFVCYGYFCPQHYRDKIEDNNLND